MHKSITGLKKSRPTGHIPILDGWRALSILAVLAGHWLPLGPSVWQLNAAAAASGMALFFCLSGFLITQFLSAEPQIGPFLIKRLFRIVPLAWLSTVILAAANNADLSVILANLLFFANLPPAELMRGGEHLWSLCVEMQFYMVIAFVVFALGRKGLLLIPIMTVIVTALRVSDAQVISIVTWHRVDEILIGGCAALVWNSERVGNVLRRVSPYASLVMLITLFVVSLPAFGVMGYARPYVAGATVLFSLYAYPQFLIPLWTGRTASYIAAISYALYVFHGMLTATPLGGNDTAKVQRLILRIPLAALTWLISHYSTFYFERAANSYGREWANSIRKRLAA